MWPLTWPWPELLSVLKKIFKISLKKYSLRAFHCRLAASVRSLVCELGGGGGYPPSVQSGWIVSSFADTIQPVDTASRLTHKASHGKLVGKTVLIFLQYPFISFPWSPLHTEHHYVEILIWRSSAAHVVLWAKPCIKSNRLMRFSDIKRKLCRGH